MYLYQVTSISNQQFSLEVFLRGQSYVDRQTLGRYQWQYPRFAQQSRRADDDSCWLLDTVQDREYVEDFLVVLVVDVVVVQRSALISCSSCAPSTTAVTTSATSVDVSWQTASVCTSPPSRSGSRTGEPATRRRAVSATNWHCGWWLRDCMTTTPSTSQHLLCTNGVSQWDIANSRHKSRKYSTTHWVTFIVQTV